MHKVLLITIGAVPAFLAAIALILHVYPLCNEDVVFEQTSPDGRYVAATMIRNCGATTQYVSHINVREAREKFRRGFFDGTVKDGEIITVATARVMRFCWLPPKRLNIAYLEPERRLAKRVEWRDLEITYGNECP